MFGKEIMDYLKELDNDPERMPYRRENDKLYDEILAQQIENDMHYTLHEDIEKFSFKSEQERAEFIKKTCDTIHLRADIVERALDKYSKLDFLNWADRILYAQETNKK